MNTQKLTAIFVGQFKDSATHTGLSLSSAERLEAVTQALALLQEQLEEGELFE